MDGRQQVVGLLLPPDFLGRAFSKSNPYFAEAASEVELCCFPHAKFERMLEDFSSLKQRLLEQTLNELDSARDWMVWLGRKTAEERVASLFLMLAERWTEAERGQETGAQNRVIELHLKRDEMADFLGLTYETVCRQISSLKRKGVIQLSGTRRFSVPNVSALTKIAG
jgi:CRP/FNR family transcriptional regulator